MIVAEAVASASSEISAVVGTAMGVIGAIATIVVAWATLRSDVRHLSARMDEHVKRHEGGDGRTGLDDRMSSLERWRERVRGAAAKGDPHRSSTHVVDDDG